MFVVMAAKGLGDAIHMRALVRHVMAREPVTVFTGWPDVFADLPISVKPLKARTGEEDIRHCNSCLHCRLPETRITSLFEMACRQAGVSEPVELRIDWRVMNRGLVDTIRIEAGSRKVLVYQPPKIVRTARELRPKTEAFLGYLERQAGCYRVKVGHAGAVQEMPEAPAELDLFGKTSVTDLLDIGSAADAFFSEPSYLPILAEAMGKPYACLFTHRAAQAGDSRVRNLTPERLFHTALGTAIYD